MTLPIEQMRVSALIPYQLNNRKHGAKQVDRIANSIKEFGFNQPIVIDADHVVIVGHGRLEAAQKLGLETVPVLRKTDLTPAQVKAYRILDNKLQNDSEWDVDNLSLELDALEEAGFDLMSWGLDEIIPEPEIEEPEVVEDAGPGDVPDETFIKRGDLIELGRHRVLCGDATSAEDVDTLLAGAQVHLFVTDPPYNVAYVGKTKKKLTIENDSMDDPAFLEFLTAAISNGARALYPGASFYIFHADSEGLNFRLATKRAELDLKQTLIWNKNTLVMGRQDYQWKHEPILYGWKPGAAHYFVNDRTLTTVWDVPKPARSAEHPTMKPLELIARCLKNSSTPGANVLDLFLGSGSTLIACEQAGRCCYGTELDPKYCQVILERYQRWCVDNKRPFECRINGEPYEP